MKRPHGIWTKGFESRITSLTLIAAVCEVEWQSMLITALTILVTVKGSGGLIVTDSRQKVQHGVNFTLITKPTLCPEFHRVRVKSVMVIIYDLWESLYHSCHRGLMGIWLKV